jgi:hypothetical protein
MPKGATPAPGDPVEAERGEAAGDVERARGAASLGGDVQPDPAEDVGAVHDPTREDRLDLPGHPRPGPGHGETREPVERRADTRSSGVPPAGPVGAEE